MDVKILEERPNRLLKRTEYRFEVSHAESATPTRDSVRSELAKLVKVPKDRLVVERMRARFGAPVSRGEAVAYETSEALRATEREHILIRNGLKERPVKAAAGAAAPSPSPAPGPAAAPAAPPPESSAKEKPT